MAPGTGRPETGDPAEDPATEVDGGSSELPTVAERALDSAPSLVTVVDRPRAEPPSSHTPAASSMMITTAAEAMKDEEVQRTRVFIRIGWFASVAGLGAIPFVNSTRWMVVIAFVAALVLGMVVSFGYHQAFRDPRNYGPRSLFVLGVLSTFNTHVAILFFGAFTIAPMLIVVGRAAADALARHLPWRELVTEQTRELVPVRVAGR